MPPRARDLRNSRGTTRQFRLGLYRNEGDSMQWSQPAFEDMRFGFEITMYISHR